MDSRKGLLRNTALRNTASSAAQQCGPRVVRHGHRARCQGLSESPQTPTLTPSQDSEGLGTLTRHPTVHLGAQILTLATGGFLGPSPGRGHRPGSSLPPEWEVAVTLVVCGGRTAWWPFVGATRLGGLVALRLVALRLAALRGVSFVRFNTHPKRRDRARRTLKRTQGAVKQRLAGWPGEWTDFDSGSGCWRTNRVQGLRPTSSARLKLERTPTVRGPGLRADPGPELAAHGFLTEVGHWDVPDGTGT